MSQTCPGEISDAKPKNIEKVFQLTLPIEDEVLGPGRDDVSTINPQDSTSFFMK